MYLYFVLKICLKTVWKGKGLVIRWVENRLFCDAKNIRTVSEMVSDIKNEEESAHL